MKKVVFFIPAILFTILYGSLALGDVGTINPIAIACLILFWIAGILLSKTIFWGGVLGLIPGAYFVYLGTQETGQVFNETPIGLVVLAYYAACMYFVFRKGKGRL